VQADVARAWWTRPRDICLHCEALPPGVIPGSGAS